MEVAREGMQRRLWRRRLQVMVLAVVAAMVAGLAPGSDLPGLGSAANAATPLAAPLPNPVLGVYGQQVTGDQIFFSRSRDLDLMNNAFNTVIVSSGKWMNGDPSVVEAVRGAGMSAILLFDWSHRWKAGEDITREVDKIIAATKANPGLISAIDVADELNSDPTRPLLTVNEMKQYLAETAGRFHEELPGVPILVDFINLQLSCGLPQQGSCNLSTRSCWPRCSYQTNNIMVELWETGYLDGYFLSYTNWFRRSDVGEIAMQRARSLLGNSAILFADTGALAFPDNNYPGTAADAAAAVEAWRTAPLRGGADGSTLWTWRKHDWLDRFRTLLDKDGSGNHLWSRLVATAPNSPPPTTTTRPPATTTTTRPPATTTTTRPPATTTTTRPPSTTTTTRPPTTTVPPGGVKCYGKTATIVGTNGNNVLRGTSGDDVIQGLGGNDTIYGLGGNDLICGGAGNDIIEGGLGNDFILGDDGDDILKGQEGQDAIAGRLGNDRIYGGASRDVMIGDRGNDTMQGSSGDDLIFGNLGRDSADGRVDEDWCKTETQTACEGPQGPWRLESSGIGPIDFGTRTDIAIAEFSRLGAPDENSGWINSSGRYGNCPNTQVRMVRWGNLRTFYSRSGTGQGTFFTWDVISSSKADDKELTTPAGLRFGDTYAQLRLRYGALSVQSGSWDFYVENKPNGISGTLSNGTYGATITHLQGGIGCGG